MSERAVAKASLSGWIEAGLYVLCIALLSVAYNVAAARDVHAVVFILYSLLISAVALLVFTGPGRNAWAIMLHPASWVVGLSNMVVEGGYAVLLGYVPPADGSLMIRLSIPVTLLIGVIVFGRRHNLLVWAGTAIVAAVVGYLMASVEPSLLLPVVACAGACGMAVGVRAFASEFHTWNRAANTVFEKIQVTALVTLVTAFAGIVVVAGLMMAIHTGHLRATPLLPTPDALVHRPTILLALFVGGALFTAMTYLSFSCVLKIRSENFIATSAFMPLATLGMQILAAGIGLITLPPFDWHLLPAIFAAIVGVLMMIWGNRRES
jgi:drug/metabolite transporter (DMT)-like permease